MKTLGLHLGQAYMLMSRATRHEDPRTAPRLSLYTPEPCTSAKLIRSRSMHLSMKPNCTSTELIRSRAVHLGLKTRGLHLDRAYMLLSRAPQHEDPRLAHILRLYAPGPCTSI
ncbi:hypothetical protein B296_00031720 [Ensete ventricosum]|uniref:Uncharacterized protein n=1 Tax=Ensete ventricosum TaxID=4639 RepID=A0A426XZB5_ENSVE|nr:hypothetical protein B296_00031720 [Ensete ventricosum]